MVSIRERERDERRRQILTQTALIVGEKGYFGFGIQELAKRCGLTKAGLLHHFASKEALLLEVLRDRDERDTEEVTAVLKSDDWDEKPPSLDKIRATFLTIVKHNLKRPELVRLFAVVRPEALNPAHPAHRHMAERDASTLKLFEKMLAPHTDQPLSVARQIHVTIHGLEVQWIQSSQSFDLLREWEVQLGRILRDVRG